MLLFSLRRLRRALFGIAPEETMFARRGFYQGDAAVQAHLEKIAQIFVQGYHGALEDDRPDHLVAALNSIEIEFRGFAFEGAAMGLALLDYFSPWRTRLATFLEGSGAPHIYMLHVGAGWTLGRLPRHYRRLTVNFDPLLAWLALDGYGFHQGFFAWQRYIQNARPPRLSGYALRAFDQGLGRSLWFVSGADVAQLVSFIERFPLARQADLWSGVGLACTYAGGVGREVIASICDAVGDYLPHLAQGAAFAAKARQRAGNLVAHTAMACEIISRRSIEEIIQIVDTSLLDLPQNETAYETWRSRIRAQLAISKTRVEQL